MQRTFSAIIIIATMTTLPSLSVRGQNFEFTPQPTISVTASQCFASLRQVPANPMPCQAALDAAQQPSSSADTLQLAKLESMLALQYARRNDLGQARTHMNSALRRAPSDYVVLAQEANILIYESQFEGAVRILNTLLQDHAQTQKPQLPSLLLNRSIALRGLGRYQESKYDYAEYLSIRKGDH